MVGDHTFKYDPPWAQPVFPNPVQPWHNLIPKPVNPQKEIVPWSLERLIEYRDLLKEIKELEDKIGCLCEPNKADYLDLFEKRIQALKNKQQQYPNYNELMKGGSS